MGPWFGLCRKGGETIGYSVNTLRVQKQLQVFFIFGNFALKNRLLSPLTSSLPIPPPPLEGIYVGSEEVPDERVDLLVIADERESNECRNLLDVSPAKKKKKVFEKI